MAFTHFIQIECDQCGHCDFTQETSIREARADAKDKGFVFVRGKMFCTERCATEFGQKASSSVSALRDE